jgi:hypothetical protein
MEKKRSLQPRESEAQKPDGDPAGRQWQEPKLTFVEPKLTHHGKLTDVTGQFFGAFSPDANDSD